jgi:hypothetical protein
MDYPRKLGVAVCTAACLFLVAPATAQEPLVEHIASQVTRDNVTTIIQTLEDFGTRYSYTTQCDDAADWLHATLEGFGLEVSYEPFEYGGKTMRNVIARQEGVVRPERVFIVGAHYDSTSQTPTVYAPGADDNASGVAAVVEAARILSQFDLSNTVEFIAFGGEEQGRRGSIHNAAQADASGKYILGVLNLDMIGYWPPTSDMELDIGKNTASTWLANAAEDAALTYATIPVHNWPNTGVCHDDHVSYWPYGISAIVLMDCYEAHQNPGGSGESTPHYHRTTDTIETLDLAQTTEAVRATVAAMAILAQPVVSPVALHVSKVPQAGDVLVSWIGGVPPYTLEACSEQDFSTGVIELTPPGGTSASTWTHSGALDDGVDYYYRVTGLF